MREDIPVAIAQTPPALTSAFVLVSPYSYSASFDGLVNPTRSEYEYIFPWVNGPFLSWTSEIFFNAVRVFAILFGYIFSSVAIYVTTFVFSLFSLANDTCVSLLSFASSSIAATAFAPYVLATNPIFISSPFSPLSVLTCAISKLLFVGIIISFNCLS